MKKTIIQTGDRQVYEKLNLLKFQNEVVIDNVLKKGIGRIEKNINKNGKNIEIKSNGTRYIIKKLRPFNLDVYLK